MSRFKIGELEDENPLQKPALRDYADIYTGTMRFVVPLSPDEADQKFRAAWNQYSDPKMSKQERGQLFISFKIKDDEYVTIRYESIDAVRYYRA